MFQQEGLVKGHGLLSLGSIAVAQSELYSTDSGAIAKTNRIRPIVAIPLNSLN